MAVMKKMNPKIIRTYSELIQLKTFEERFEYLKLDGIVGRETFGFDRYLNQMFYSSIEWKRFRRDIILRDNGCDLAMPGLDIVGKIFIHHLNPITKEDILNRTEYLMNPEFVICSSKLTHDAIHYGDSDLLPKGPIERKRNDTCPWRH